jgi:transposase
MIMIMDVLLPDTLRLCLDRIEIEENIIVLLVSSTSPVGLCPLCGALSDQVHSHYQRQPTDLPLAGYAVRMDINVRKFFCNNNDCQRVIFCERMPSLIATYARYTNRLAGQQQQVAFSLGGEVGSRMLTIMGMAVSPDTLLRFIRKAPEPEITTPRVLGVDDWAKRKGQSYGTILVDLEKHRTIDLLPERSAESLATWLKAHPGVEVISRDRGTEYIKGATDGAPDAIQVADRWHLLNNLKDALKRILEGKRATLKAVAESEVTESEGSANCAESGVPSINTDNNRDIASAEPSDKLNLPNPEDAITPVLTSGDSVQKEQTDIPQQLTKVEQEKQTRHERRQERYEEVQQLHRQGLSIRKIARRFKLSRITVRKYIEAETCPIYPEGVSRGSKLTPYIDYIQQRLESGCHNASQIWRELCQLGYDGSRGLVARWVANERVNLPLPQTEESHQSCVAQSCSALDNLTQGSKPGSKREAVPWSPNRAAWLLIRPEGDLTLEDRQALERVKQSDEDVAEAYSLGQRFVSMIRERQSDALFPWLEDALKSGTGALKGFANGIQQDMAAVMNALSLPWSQGQVEGQVNRLKLIKRQMYGRANFDLLRKRVITYPARC